MNIIRKIFRGLGMAAMMTALLSTAVACSDDLLGDGEIRQNADGTYGPFDIAVSFDAEANDSHTRATFSNDGFKLECAWVAMFTAKTGKLVAMAESDPSSFGVGGSAPDTNHANGAGDNYKVILRSLMLNDEYDEVVIAGVANYKDIMARDSAGNEMPLIEALREIKDIRGYKNIAVSTSSAEQAMGGDNKPLMAGFWGNGHGNFTVSQAGDIYAEQERTFKVKMLDTNTKKVIGQTAIDGGMIHLRRLYSKLNVGITIDSKAFRKFENPRLKVYNVPAYAFITEHKTIEDASQEQYDNETWTYRTHTAADIYENGYFETEVISEAKPLYSTTKGGAFLMDSGDKFTVRKDGDNTTINFGFWHYETKHWGLPGVKSQNDRGRMHGDSGIYSSLCPSVDKNFNNNAALMVLTADVVSADGKFSGTADFYIHEGYCCQPNSLAATSAEEASRDFSTFRNVEYTYAVRISGMESVDAKVSSRDLSDDFYYGVGGDLYSESVTRSMPVPEGGISYDIELPGDELYWYIDSEGETFGVPLGSDPDIQKWYGGVYKYTDEPEIQEDNEFYQSIRLDGALLGDAVTANTRAGGHTISFTGTPGVNGLLYICAVQRSLDNRVTYHTLYAFDQLGKLATPKLEMLKAPAGNVMMGIDDHTVYWKPVTGASTYTIELAAEGAMGGYKVTLNPENGPVSDAQGTSPINVKINKETIGGTEYLKFKIRYANSAKGMLSFLQSADSHQVTIKVTAHKANGESSEPGTITRTILNPVWDFTSDPWKSAIQAQCNGVEMPPNTVISLNGLTYHCGSAATTTKYQQFGSVYGLRPGGAGNLDPVTRMFSFHSCSDRGKLAFWTTSNSGNASSGRYVMVDCKGTGENLVQSPDAVTKGTGSAASDFANIKVTTSSFYPTDYDVAGSQNVRFYNSGDLVYYKIQYTPEDQ